MIVKICFTPECEQMVECDTVHKSIQNDKLELAFYKNGKLIEDQVFNHGVQVFIMENGRTIDRIDF